MAIKLGQLLINEKIITPDELDEALKSQVVYGGRLGSILIELGLIEEDKLARFLSKKLHAPYAAQQMFEDVPAEVLTLVPKEYIQKYRVVPLSVQQRRLNLAMADPSDLAAIDEISFVTGLIIVPMVAPEVRLVFSLEKYYGIKRDARYLYRQWAPSRLMRKGAGAGTPVQQAPAPPPVNPFVSDLELDELPILDLTDMDQEIAAVDIDIPLPSTGTPALEHAGPFTLDNASVKLAQVKDRDEIAEIIIQYAGEEFERAAIFLIRGDHIVGWQAVMHKQPVAGFKNFKLSLEKPSLLKTVTEGKISHLGPVPDTAENQHMLAVIGGGFPETAHLLPILIMERVVTILYVDGKETDVLAKSVSLQKLANKVTMAFSILIMRNKILAT